MRMLDSELFLPQQIRRAVANGVRFDWLTFDEWYGAKPAFLADLDAIGLLYVCEVPRNLLCFPSLPRYRSTQKPFQPKRVDNAVIHGKPFLGRKWRKISLQRKTLGPQAWEIKAAQVYLARDGQPTARTYWLIVARNVQTREIKYFVSNAPPKTAVTLSTPSSSCIALRKNH